MRLASSFQAAVGAWGVGRPAKGSRVGADNSIHLRETKPVSEPTDWKQKYRDSLLEMEAEEKRWREVERLLRRLIGRLCAAGLGVDSRLWQLRLRSLN